MESLVSMLNVHILSGNCINLICLNLRSLCFRCSGTAPPLPVTPSQHKRPTGSTSSPAASRKTGSQNGRERFRCGQPAHPQLSQEAGVSECAVGGVVSVCVNGSSHAQAKLAGAANSIGQGPTDMQPISQPLQQGLLKAGNARQQGKQARLQAARKVAGKLVTAGRLAQNAAGNQGSPACCLQDIVGTALGYNHSIARQAAGPMQCSSTALAKQKTVATGRPKPKSCSANESGGVHQLIAEDPHSTAGTCGIMSVQGVCSSSRDQPVTPETGAELQRRPGGRPSAKPSCVAKRKGKLEEQLPSADLEGGQPLDLGARGTSWTTSAVQLC